MIFLILGVFFIGLGLGVKLGAFVLDDVGFYMPNHTDSYKIENGHLVIFGPSKRYGGVKQKAPFVLVHKDNATHRFTIALALDKKEIPNRFNRAEADRIIGVFKLRNLYLGRL